MLTKYGNYITVDPGVELFIQDVGEGDPIVFIPGWTFTTEVFHKQVEHFQQTNRVIVIDPRSHGRSTITLHGNEYITHGIDLAKVIDELKLKNITLVGWSFGCLTVWEYFKQYGTENITSAILVDLPPKSLSVHEDVDWVEGKLDDIASAYTTYLRDTEKQRDFVTGYITDVMVQRDLLEPELKWLVEQSLKTPYYIAANLFAAGMFSDYREEAKLVSETIPTLTVIAEHWDEVGKAYTEKLTPKSKIEVLGGHMMFWEYDRKFNQLLESFLTYKWV